jgi:hypothetical protein
VFASIGGPWEALKTKQPLDGYTPGYSDSSGERGQDCNSLQKYLLSIRFSDEKDAVD